MKTRFGVLLLVLLFASQATADSNGDQSPYITVTLSAPSNPYVNLADCNNASNVLLTIGWSASKIATTGTSSSYPFFPWQNTDWADAFFSSSSGCADIAIEIRGKSTGTVGSSGFSAGQDVDISPYVNEPSGTFPDNTSTPTTLTLQEVLTSTNFQSVAGTGDPCQSKYQEDLHFCLQWQEGPYTDPLTYLGGNNVYYAYKGGALIRFDFQPPGEPVLTSISPGDTNLKITWTAPSDTDLANYNIYHIESGADNESDINNWSKNTLTDSTATSYQITGLQNNVTYDVVVSAVDKAENEGATSNPPLTGTPIPIYDFFRTYKKDGGKEDGGFCFVATAAYGSYQDSMVMLLRQFRDATLSHSHFGRELIAGYYQYGPRWARAIRDSAFYRTVARSVLLPVVAVAEAINYLGLGVLLFLSSAMLFVLYGVRRSRRWRIPKSGPAVGAMLLFFSMAARPIEARAEEPQFQIQLRFGQYHPAVDSEANVKVDPKNNKKPFEAVFGSGKSWLFEIDGDYEIWRGFGAVTIGGSFGYVQYVGKGLTESGAKSSDTAVLNLLPLRLTAGYHFDMLARWWNVPLVPYVGGGLSYYFWWSTNGVGDISTSLPDANGNTIKGRGGIFGFHVLGGMKFLLDVLDPDAAMNLENSIGIMNTYLFVEYQWSFINNFGKSSSMKLDGNNIMFGMMVEF